MIAYRAACISVGVVLGVCSAAALGVFGALLGLAVAWLVMHPVAFVCITAGALAAAVVLLAFVHTSKHS